MTDLLDMEYINSLPQPFLAQQYGDHGDDWLWPVHDIEVQTGLVRIDVCGMLDTKHIGDFKIFRDANGKNHDADDFYIDAERAATSLQKGGEDASAPLNHCAAARDGECSHAQCPQLRDGEPAKSGRHCPLDHDTEEE